MPQSHLPFLLTLPPCNLYCYTLNMLINSVNVMELSTCARAPHLLSMVTKFPSHSSHACTSPWDWAQVPTSSGSTTLRLSIWRSTW